MFFTSTRKNCEITASAAIAKGISDDGGLFVPSEFPRLQPGELETLAKLPYKDRAARILQKFLNDYSAEELKYCVEGAYEGRFDNNEPAPLKEIAPGINILELWHGPTCAFKDMALQILPYLLTVATRKNAPERTTVILVATSGDTGKAALEGFADVPGTKIIVFFPRDGVSDMQKLQMTTQKGANVAVCAIEGNFDDAQTGVKNIFADKAVAEYLAERNMEFSSANSINFGRLAPQIVYYISRTLPEMRSMWRCPPATSEISLPHTTPSRWDCRSSVLSALPTATIFCLTSSRPVFTTATGSSTPPKVRRWTSLYPPIWNGCSITLPIRIAN